MPRKEYRLVKLKASTVRDLKNLLRTTGKASLDELINQMLQITYHHRLAMKQTGWGSPFGGEA